MFLKLIKNLFLNKNTICKYLINKYRNFLISSFRNHSNMDVYLEKNLKKNIIAFDVGAHIGESVARLKKIFPNSAIHCFEPVLESFNILKKNVSFFGFKKIILNNFLLFSSNRKTYINIFPKSELSSIFFMKKKGIRQKVQTITIDDYIRINNIKFVDYLKIDTQGSELKILHGAKKALKNKKIKFIEIEIIFKNKNNQYKNSLSFYHIEKYLNQYEYYLVKLDGIGEYKDLSTSQVNALYKLNF